MITDIGIRFPAPFKSEITAEARMIQTGRSLRPVSVDRFDANRTRITVAQVNGILLWAKKTDSEAE